MKFKTLYLMLGLTCSLTGCASSPQFNQFMKTLAEPPVTTENNEDDTTSAPAIVRYDAKGNVTEARCKEVEGSGAMSARVDQQKCAERKMAGNEATYSKGTTELVARNPPDISELGEAGQEGEKVLDKGTGLYRRILIDRQVKATDTGFSLDFAPMHDSSVYKMEFRKVASDECQGLPGLEQTVWIDHKDGAPKAKKIHCFEPTEKRIISMMGDLENDKGRVLLVDGSMSNGEPWVHVYLSQLQQVY